MAKTARKPRPAPPSLTIPPELPAKEQLRVKAVGMVLTHEVNTGHMSPQLAKFLLSQMDQAYNLLLSAAYPEQKERKGPSRATPGVI